MTMRARRLIAVLAGAAAIAVPTVASAPASATPASGSLVLIGGNLAENEEILTTIVDLARAHAGGERPTIAIVTAAAAPAKTPGQANNAKLNNAAANGLYYAELFQALGADTYAVPIDGSVDFKKDAYVPANAHSPEVAAAVAAADGVFFGGGDQMRYVRTLMTCTPADAADEAYTDCTDTPVLAAVRSVVDGGGVVAGVSAGLTIQQGPDMVTGGESWQAWRDGATPGYLDDATALAYLPAGGFGFFTEGLLDSHFTTWGRQARMIRLADELGHDLVVGVDETTALVVDRATRTGDVIGRHGVSLLDLSAADGGVRWSYLVAGDRIDFASGAVTPGVVANGAGAGTAPTDVADVWDSIDGLGNVYTLRDLARSLVASADDTASGRTFETDPQYRTTLVRDADTSWWGNGATVGFHRVLLEITTVG